MLQRQRSIVGTSSNNNITYLQVSVDIIYYYVFQAHVHIENFLKKRHGKLMREFYDEEDLLGDVSEPLFLGLHFTIALKYLVSMKTHVLKRFTK